MDTALSRRTALCGGLGLGALLIIGGCTAAPVSPPAVPVAEPDPLPPLAATARADAALAAALAAASTAGGDRTRVPALLAIADERRAHADALDAEIVRAAGRVDGTPVAVGPTNTTATGVQASPAALITALNQARNAAATQARLGPSYRAGLLGSIAASCAAGAIVLG